MLFGFVVVVFFFKYCIQVLGGYLFNFIGIPHILFVIVCIKIYALFGKTLFNNSIKRIRVIIQNSFKLFWSFLGQTFTF